MKFKTKPYKHQMEAYDRFKDQPYFALFMEMGTGKSKVAIDIATYKYEKGEIDSVLVIAPNNVHSQWLVEQFPIHCSIDYKPFLWKSAKVNTNIYQTLIERFLMEPSDIMKVMAVNVEAFQSDTIVSYIANYVKHNKVFIIIDEATRIKTPTAKRSKVIHRLQKYGERCILTGTPVTKSPFGLWSMFEFLQHNFFGVNYYIFQARHGVMMQGINQRTGGRYKTLIDEKTWNITLSILDKMRLERNGDLMPDDYSTAAVMVGLSEKNIRFIDHQKQFKKYKRLDELKAKIDPVTFYANKKDCLDLPEKIYQTLYVEMTKEHRKVYNTLKKKMLVQYADKELTVVNKVALTTRLMQICGGYFPYIEDEDTELAGEVITVTKQKSELIGKKNIKLERILEELDETAHFPIIIWAKFVVELKAIFDYLKKDYHCALYYGKTSQSERERIIDDFKKGKYEIFIGNPSVAGFGLNLQNATTQYYYSNGFNVEERLQAEDRSHRMGVKEACIYKDIVFKNTIDEKITKAITVGREMNDFFKSQTLAEILSEE